MKKLTALFLALLLCCSLLACTQPAAPTAQPSGEQPVDAGETASIDVTADVEETAAPVPLEALPVPESYSAITLEHVKDVELDVDVNNYDTKLRGLLGKCLLYDDASEPVSITWDYGPEAERRGVEGGTVVPVSLLSLENGKTMKGCDAFRLFSEQYGLIGFRTFKEDVNRWGLLDADMNVIMEDSAAWIWKRSDRFLQIFFATGVTQNRNEAMYSYGEFLTYPGGESSPFDGAPYASSDGILYTGVCRVYDCEKQAFVPGLEWSEYKGCSANNQTVHVGSRFYDASGAQVFTTEGMPNAGHYNLTMTDKYVVLKAGVTSDTTVHVFDGAMNPKGSVDVGPQDFTWYSKGRYVSMMGYDQKVSVLDLETVQHLVSDITAVKYSGAMIVEGTDAIACQTEAGTALYSLPDFTKLMDVEGETSPYTERWCANGLLFCASLGSLSAPVYTLEGTLLGSTGYETYLMENAAKNGFTALLSGETVISPLWSTGRFELIAPFLYQSFETAQYLQGAVETLNGTQLLPEEYNCVIGSKAFICAYSRDSLTLEIYRIVRA